MTTILVEMNNHLTDREYSYDGSSKGNSREGYYDSTINGSFSHCGITPKHARLEIFDEKILSLYAGGMTVRDIQSHLLGLYGMEVSTSLISTVTKALKEK